jgi:hypothetical protein
VCERDINRVLVGCSECESDSNMTLVDTVLMMLNHLQIPYRLLGTKLWAPNPGGADNSHNLAAVFLLEPLLGWACHGCCEALSASCLTSGLRLFCALLTCRIGYSS